MSDTALEMRYRQEEAVRRMFPHIVDAHRWLAKVSVVARVRISSQIEHWDRRRLKRELRRAGQSTYRKLPNA